MTEEELRQTALGLCTDYLQGRGLRDVHADGDRIVAEERLLTDLRPRVRDVRQGPDGFVYVLSETDGRLLRIGLAR